MDDNKKKRINITIFPEIHSRLKELALEKNTDVSKLIMGLVEKAATRGPSNEHNWIWALKGDTLERIEQYAYEHHTTPEQAVTDWAFQEKGSHKTGHRRSARRNGGKAPDKKDSKTPELYVSMVEPTSVTAPAELDKDASEVPHTDGMVIEAFLQEPDEENLSEPGGSSDKNEHRDSKKNTCALDNPSEESAAPSSYQGLSQYDDFLRGGF